MRLLNWIATKWPDPNIARGGSMKRGMSRLELFVSGKLIKPYVSSDLDERVRNPIKFPDRAHRRLWLRSRTKESR